MRFITGNEGKFREAMAHLGELDIGLEMAPMDYPEVQADSLNEVALFGARFLARDMDQFFIEDSGLFIDALDGFPGVYSRYVKDTLGLDGVLRLLDDRRQARFESCIVMYDGEFHTFNGVVAGSISREPAGADGFGYDPIFIPEGRERTFAEMSVDEKNALSHRGKALESLANHLR